jgi:hypothetical protein
MSDHVTSDTIVAEPTVLGRVIEVHRLTWDNSDGLSFDLYDKATGHCLTVDGSYDDQPGEDEIAEALRGGMDSEATCRICATKIIADGHLFGAVSTGKNPWCCNGCWDERLR